MSINPGRVSRRRRQTIKLQTEWSKQMKRLLTKKKDPYKLPLRREGSVSIEDLAVDAVGHQQ